MKLRILGVLGLALAVCLSSALVAQEEGRGRGRGGPGGGAGGPGGGFRGGPGGGFQLGGALDLMGLLRDEKVRAEVDMSEETYSAVQENLPSMRDLFQASESERAAKLKEANTQAQETLDEVLSPEHQKRLMGLLVQQRGNQAATNDLIAKEIGLDEAGVKKVQEAAAKAGESMRDKMREAFQNAGGDREKIREMMEGMRAETDKAIAAALTPAQLKSLEALKGAKFEFSENRGFGGGRGPGGDAGGGGRPGGRGNRPSGDN